MCETVALLLVLVNSTSFGSANRATYIEAGLLRTRPPLLTLRGPEYVEALRKTKQARVS